MTRIASVPVAGPWDRLHRSESDILAGLLSAAELAAVNRRLGLATRGPQWVPADAGESGGRFAAPRGPGALYLGDDLATCAAEVAHHHGRRCAASLGTPPGSRAVFRHLVFQVAGTMAEAARTRRLLYLPEDYGPSWAYGANARAAGLAGVHYRSVRRKAGLCLAVFEDAAAVFLRVEFGAVILEWDGAVSRRIG